MAANKNEHGEGCMCGTCRANGCGCGSSDMMSFQHNTIYHVLRWLFAIAILIIVFSVGIQVGILASGLQHEGDYGYSQGYYMRPMMYTNAGTVRTTTMQVPATTVPATAPAQR